jgi:carboxynorspermidine decarboxylase
MAIDYTKIPSPCYVIDEEKLRKNLELIKRVSSEAEVEIVLAFKGFSMWKAFPVLREYIQGATASGSWEARLAKEEMKVLAHTYSPAFKEEDFGEVLKNSSHITFNSLSQFDKFYPATKEYSRKISVGIRVNPEHSEVETELYNPCAPGTRLGILAEQLGDRLPEGIEGLHFHNLCESSSLELEKTLKIFEEKFGRYIPQVKWINMGGGHLITRKGYDTGHLVSLLKKFRERWNGVKVILEPGSAFVWETGVLVSSVVDIVENRGIKTAILDVSFTAHMPDCLEMPYKPRIAGAWNEPVEGKPTYRMGGNSCLAGDYAGYWSFDNELKAGDLIIFEDMIHYTVVKSTMFNGVHHPSLGIWKMNNTFQLYREYEYKDYKNRMA